MSPLSLIGWPNMSGLRAESHCCQHGGSSCYKKKHGGSSPGAKRTRKCTRRRIPSVLVVEGRNFSPFVPPPTCPRFTSPFHPGLRTAAAATATARHSLIHPFTLSLLEVPLRGGGGRWLCGGRARSGDLGVLAEEEAAVLPLEAVQARIEGFTE